MGTQIYPKDHVYLIEQSVTGFFEKRILLAPFGENELAHGGSYQSGQGGIQHGVHGDS